MSLISNLATLSSLTTGYGNGRQTNNARDCCFPNRSRTNFPLSGRLNLHLLQICVRRWVSKYAQHRDNLAFVMKCVSYHMQEDKSRTAEFPSPIYGAFCQGSVQLLFGERVQIGSSRHSYSFFRDSQCCHRWTIPFVPTGEDLVLQIVNPSFLAAEDMHKLPPNRRVAVFWNRRVNKIV